MRFESILLLCSALASLTNAFIAPNQAFCFSSHNGTPNQPFSIVLNAKGPGKFILPPNEFSRTYKVDSILGGGSRQRDFKASIEANEDERTNLAARFDLFNIGKLQADLMLRKEGNLGGSTRGTGVLVEGTVVATVTQTCVRTGETFDLDVEFPLLTVARQLVSIKRGREENDDMAEVDRYSKKDKGSPTKQKNIRAPDRNLNEMDIMDLQFLLQDTNLDEDVMEDESIYSNEGILDVGELVAQLFWLKLDPYPKKPGTQPVRYSVSG